MLGTQIQYSVIAIFVALLMAHMLNRTTANRTPAGQPAISRPVAHKPAAAPTRAMLATQRGEHRIAADSMGQYSTDAEINGARISNMLVDTGATMVALSYEDASAVGVFPAPADYKYTVSTANGVAHVARVKLHDVRIGSLVVHDVDALVGERGALGSSLLGMTFLSRLSRFEVASGALVLRQ